MDTERNFTQSHCSVSESCRANFSKLIANHDYGITVNFDYELLSISVKLLLSLIETVIAKVQDNYNYDTQNQHRQ